MLTRTTAACESGRHLAAAPSYETRTALRASCARLRLDTPRGHACGSPLPGAALRPRPPASLPPHRCRDGGCWCGAPAVSCACRTLFYATTQTQAARRRLWRPTRRPPLWGRTRRRAGVRGWPLAPGLTAAPAQAIKSNGMLYMSGSVGLVPAVCAAACVLPAFRVLTQRAPLRR